MPALLFDLDGVLYESNRAVAGATEAISWFNKNNVPHIFLTNTSSRPRSALVEKLKAFEISSTAEQFLTPPLAAVQWLNKNHINGPVALFIPEATQEEFSAFNICNEKSKYAAAVVVGDLGQAWDYNKLNHAFNLLINNPDAVLIALGMTRYWRAEEGLRLDAGPYVTALQYATGKEAIVTGKPAPAFYESALNLLKVSANNCYMIGDDIKGDIEAAQNIGIKALLVRTGKFTSTDLETGIIPNAVIDSIADLTDWWCEHVK